jgi:hypothetical protein
MVGGLIASSKPGFARSEVRNKNLVTLSFYKQTKWEFFCVQVAQAEDPEISRET